MSRHVIFSALLTLGFTAPAIGFAWAQEEPIDVIAEQISNANALIDTSSNAVSGCLSFRKALQLSAQNDPNVTIARADLLAAEAGLVEAKSLTRPQVSAFTRSGFGDEGLVNSTIANQLGLRASQRVFDFGDSRLAREAAQEGIFAQENLVLSASSAAMLEAGLAYIDWLDATERLDATVERADYFSRELSALETALESGGATMAEVAEISAEQAEAEADRFELDFERSHAATRLAIATHSKQSICAGAEPMVQSVVDILESGQKSDTFSGRALADNAEVKALKQTAKRLNLEAQRQKKSRLPVVDIVGITSLTSDRRFDNFEFRERIGIDLSMPIFTGSALSARTDQARARAQRAAGKFAQRRQELEEQVTTTHQRALLLNAQLGRRQAVIEFRETEFAAAQNGYQSRIRTLPELVDIRLQLEDARLAEIRTRYNYLRQALTLKSLSGAI